VNELPRVLPGIVARCFSADPAAWLLKARSPLVKYRAAVDLLGWPPECPEARNWWARRYEDPDLSILARAQGTDGLWAAEERLWRRYPSLVYPLYRGALWQLPILADLAVGLSEDVCARAARAILSRRADDGSFDLGRGGSRIRSQATTASGLAALGIPASELAAVHTWLESRQRDDGGWADVGELARTEDPSPVGTTAEVLRALGSAEGAAAARARAAAREFLCRNYFTEYNGRFRPHGRAWRRLSWPQYRFDVLSVATAARTGGATRAEVAPLAEGLRAAETHRGFWRQTVPLAGLCIIDPVRAGRASRWITLKAASFLRWYYEDVAESGCGS
jgi:hypothetical protein